MAAENPTPEGVPPPTENGTSNKEKSNGKRGGKDEVPIEELYDLHDDPDELTNVAMKPELQDQLIALRKATIAELKRTDAGIVNRLPHVAGE